MRGDCVVAVKFDGVLFDRWTSVQQRESVDDLCATVAMAYVVGDGTDKTVGALPLTPNTVVEVWIDDLLVSTVRSDVRRRKVGSTSVSQQLEGRTLARELVDCQYSTTLKGLRLAEIAKRLCSTFKVPLQVDVQTALVPDFSMQSEVPANALINAVRAANLLLYPTASGGLVLREPTAAAAVATLEYGTHIEEYEVVDEDKLRYSDYVVRSFDYSSDKALKAGAKDGELTFFRPMHIVADRHSQNLGSCERRAQLERNRRQARAHRLELQVRGWYYQDAQGVLQLWAINTQVRVVIKPEGIDAVFLIGDLVRTMDENGVYTKLQVMSREAFVGEVKKKSKRGAGVAKKKGGK